MYQQHYQQYVEQLKAHGIDEFTKTLETTIIESEEYDHEKIFEETEKFVGL